MKQNTKHSLVNLRYLDSAATHLDRYVRYLSTFSSRELLRRVFVLKSWIVCVCLLRIESCVCFFPSLTLVLLL
jgi:cell division protein ZapA (FtsZ GTPase activity inhibitor)